MKKVFIIFIVLMASIMTFGQISPQYLYADDSCHVTLPDYRDTLDINDNCCLDTVLQIPEPGLTQATGDTTEVQIIALDCSGNATAITFAVFTIDTIPPTIELYGEVIPPDPPDPPIVDVVKRLIVLADPNVDPGKESDDAMSLVRLMVYSNMFDIEGLIATVSHNLAYRYVEPFYKAIDAYEEVRPNLIVHADGYPEPDALRAVVALGPAQYATDYALNEEPISDGAQLIIDAIFKDDSRPIYIQIWGDGAVIAQALEYIRINQGQAVANAAAAKLRVYDIAGQDDSGAWLKAAENYPNLFYIRGRQVYFAMDPHSDISSLYVPPCGDKCSQGDSYYTDDAWAANNVQNHGPLGAIYPDRRYLKEGDTPSMLYMLDNGLNDPAQPWMGSWGGRYTRTPIAGIRSNRDPLTEPRNYPEADSDPYFMYGSDNDTWSYDGGTWTNEWTTIFRWWPDFQNDFGTRMDWSLTNVYSEVNHPPFVVANGDRTKNIIYMNVSPSQTVNLSALGSMDPDGNNLSYTWWNYREAGTYNNNVNIINPNSSEASVTIPINASGKEIHIIVSAVDDGVPNNTRYRRLVMNVQ
jgi:hypothetical protein